MIGESFMEKTAGEMLKEKLFYTKKHAAEILNQAEIDAAFDFCKGYREFLDYAKNKGFNTVFTLHVFNFFYKRFYNLFFCIIYTICVCDCCRYIYCSILAI